jgi:hypothetical protein
MMNPGVMTPVAADVLKVNPTKGRRNKLKVRWHIFFKMKKELAMIPKVNGNRSLVWTQDK